MKAIVKKSAASLALCLGLATPSYAQLDGLTGAINMGGAGMPDLAGGLNMGGGASALGDIPVLGPVLDLLAGGEFLEALTPNPPVERFSRGNAVVEGLILGSAGSPQAVFATIQGLGMNAGYAAVPVFQVLVEDPASLFDYFMNGGTILFPAAGSSGGSGGSVFPGAPLITDPLDI